MPLFGRQNRAPARRETGSLIREGLHTGMVREGWLFTRSRLAMAILGPPGAGKTTALLVPQLLMCRGPAVAVTVKHTDLFTPTALTRARLGRLWHYNPGEGETLPGCVELRWSPITGAEDWTTAVRSSKFLTDEVLEVGGNESSGGAFFRTSAKSLVAVALHAAALAGQEMRFVKGILSNNTARFDQAHAIIYSKGHPTAVEWIDSVRNADNRTRDNIFSTAIQVFDALATDKPYASTLNPNFDPDAFAASNDTVYITAERDDQASLQPLFVHLLKAIERAQRLRWRPFVDEAVPKPPMMYWALDELASMARIRGFPSLVTDSGSAGGLEIAACLQDLSQSERLWSVEGKNLLGRMAAVVFPGITNRDTLETIAALAGKSWVTREASSYSTTTTLGESYSGQGRSESFSAATTRGTSETHFYVENATPGNIYAGNLGMAGERGGRPGNNMICFHSGELRDVEPTRYFNRPPFREALAGNVVYAAQNFHDERAALPVPRVAVETLNQQWQEKYLAASRILFERRRERGFS